MKYRIVVEIEVSGIKHYYLQIKKFGLFWCYRKSIDSISMLEYKTHWNSLEEIDHYIKVLKITDSIKKQSKIIKKEYILR